MDATQATAVVTGFLAAWRDRDLDAIMSYMADDTVYHNVPVAPIAGKAAVRQMFAALLEMFPEVALEVINFAAQPDLVLTERVDRFVMRDSRIVTVPVCGVFELRDGRITRFSDYFDLAGFEAASGLKL